jgi:hypothetical protein
MMRSFKPSLKADAPVHWLVDQQRTEPYVTVFDKSARTDGTFSQGEFAFACSTKFQSPLLCARSSPAKYHPLRW